MSRFAFTCFVWLAPVGFAQSQDAAPLRDGFGDALPAGAIGRIGTVRLRQDFVQNLAFLPDGKSLVVQGSGGVVLWDATTGKMIRSFPDSAESNRASLGLSRDGLRLATRNDDNTVAIWDVPKGNLLFRLECGMASPAAAISPNHSLIAIGSPAGVNRAIDSGIVLWDGQTGMEQRVLTRTKVSDLQFSPDGKWVAGVNFQGGGFVAGTGDSVITLFNVTTGEAHPAVGKLATEKGYLRGFVFTPNGESLAVSLGQAGIRIWDIKTQKEIRRLKTNAHLAAISPDSNSLAVIDKQDVIIFDIASGEEIRRLQIEDRMTSDAGGAFSPDGKSFAIGFEGGIQIWSLASGRRLDPYRAPIHLAQPIAISPDGATVAACYEQHTLKLFDTVTRQEKSRLPSGQYWIESPLFSPDGRRLAFVERPLVVDDRNPIRVRLMDVATGKESVLAKNIVGRLSQWQDRDTLVVSENSQKGIAHRMVDAATGLERDRKDMTRRSVPRWHVVHERDRDGGPTQWFLADDGKKIRPVVFTPSVGVARIVRDGVGFSPDHRLMIVLYVNADGSTDVGFFETSTGRERFGLKSVFRLTFSADGGRIVTLKDKQAAFYDALTLEPFLEPRMLNDIAFSATGKFMVTAESSSLLVWNLAALPARKIAAEKVDEKRLAGLWEDLRSDDAGYAHLAMIALVGRPSEAVAFLRTQFPKGPVILGDADRVRWLRAVEILEGIGSVDADSALQALRGFDDPNVAADAARAMERRSHGRSFRSER